MAFADFADYQNNLTQEKTLMFSYDGFTNATTNNTGFVDCLLLTRPYSGAVPETKSSLDKTSAPALNKGMPNFSPNYLRIVGGKRTSGNLGICLIIDRLCQSGTFVTTSTATNTTNLPTAALPRYTSGVGVMIGIIASAAMGASNSYVTVSYTNSDGVSGRTTPGTSSLGSNLSNQNINGCIILPLQAGDIGVKSVESVKISATTNLASSFGVVLFKPLSVIFGVNKTLDVNSDLISGGLFGLERIEDNACLGVMLYYPTASGAATGGTAGQVALLYGTT